MFKAFSRPYDLRLYHIGRPYPGALRKECRYGGGLRLQPQATRGREALLPLGGRWYPRRLQRPRSLNVAQHGFFKAAGEPLERLLRHRLLGLGQAEGETLLVNDRSPEGEADHASLILNR